ncbi:MAG: carotenoid oxygenase family protein [Burkholderiaceae bacterium]
MTANRYLGGNFAPVAQEITATDLPVQGELPPELIGRYVRNGPNPAAEVNPKTHHWFMGDGMVHGIRLAHGKAHWYRNRYVGSAALSRLREQPDIPGPNWCASSLGPNTNVGGFAGKTWALVESGGVPVELTYELETVGRNNFNGSLPGAFSAHPKYDPLTGEWHAMAYAWAQWMDHIQYVVVTANGRVSKTVDIPLPGMSMIHDMALTSTYAIVFDQPVTVDIGLAMKREFPFRWNPGYGNRIGLLRRDAIDASNIIWIDLPLGYAFHPLNAYDTDDGQVVVDICNYEKVFDQGVHGVIGPDGIARLERWQLKPEARTVSVTVIDESFNEFPRHRDSVGGQMYRYGYCVSPSSDPHVGWPTLKHDLQTGQRQTFDHGPGRAAGEAVFVPREASSAEDDGWLLMLVHEVGSHQSGGADLVVLDARDFSRGEVARVTLPQRVPFGFHGNWIADALSEQT